MSGKAEEARDGTVTGGLAHVIERKGTAMRRRYVTVDVFTDEIFGGNPLAVVLDAAGLSASQMQAMAREFNYSETTFVFPAQRPGNTARVRIFTCRTELPFAGHPNVGTAVVLARALDELGTPAADELSFEELSGIVRVRLRREDGVPVGAEITAPRPLSTGARVPVEDTAECLSLSTSDILTTGHDPVVVSVGLPFLAAELTSSDALARTKPNTAAHARILPPLGTDAVFAYHRGSREGELHARMFSPLDATIEDPATGSAAAATIALLASLRGESDEDRSWTVIQGVDMGRPSVIEGRTTKRRGAVASVDISGRVVTVMSGSFDL